MWATGSKQLLVFTFLASGVGLQADGLYRQHWGPEELGRTHIPWRLSGIYPLKTTKLPAAPVLFETLTESFDKCNRSARVKAADYPSATRSASRRKARGVVPVCFLKKLLK